jgi:hypothetical protein
MYYKYCCV